MSSHFSTVTGETQTPLTIDAIRSQCWQQVQVDWMVGNIRNLSAVSFLAMQLFRWNVQWVLEWDMLDLRDWVKKGDYIQLSGIPRLNERAQNGVEIWVNGIRTLATGDSGNFQFIRGMRENLDVLLDNRVVTLRNAEQKAIFKLADGVSRAFREFLTQEQFTEIHSPKIVASWAEWGANVFALDYFWKQAYLAQSPQFYKQFMVPVFHRVFEIAPAFRAEKHGTSRHINEYTSLDMEMWPIGWFRDIMNMEVKFLRFLINFLRQNYAWELLVLNVDLPEIGNGIPEVTFDQAKEIVATHTQKPIEDPHDMEPEEERTLSKIIKDTTGSDFVFVTHFPFEKRPFYTMPSETHPGKTEWFDLLFRGLEITTWWQRIHDYTMQVENMRKKWLNPDDFADFLALHKAGTMPHGGFWIGSERLLQKLLWRSNIRETTLFPRDRSRLTP